MIEKRKPIPVTEAIARLMNHIPSVKTESVPLQQAYGRILAENIIARHDIPHFNRSAYDGFAIRSQDSEGASGESRVTFRVVDHIGAGHVSKVVVGEHEAVRIMTGAALPEGADAVVMFEQARAEGEDSFSIRKPFKPGENISYQGEDAKVGTELIKAGGFIHPGTIALLATLGYAQVKVAKKPIVGIIATGTELLDVNDELQPGKIRNSNGYMIEAQLQRMGIEFRSYGMQSDDLDQCYETVVRALSETDCLITTGGVSVGDFDFAPAVYKRLNADVLFNKILMRPGSVTTAAVSNHQYLFGLSGNPSACFSGFELLVRPVLLKMMGCNKPYLQQTKAILTEDFLKPNPFTRFIRASYEFGVNGPIVKPAGFNKSNAVTSIANGNAIIVLPSGTRGYEAGTEVDVLLLGTEEGVAEWNL
ncbi:molybdopterin molybdotransferase MoeA [Bacillus massiliigorillae]|uniref:molybdopterin molybdotransferase MoeA n=1 Tax=Bacillus massiliigorillae TaxID=1243664 RepID=UPI0003AA3CDA|nr:gephyrin-like molybdotransferase Glp [Bacillus massiliigorillae]